MKHCFVYHNYETGTSDIIFTVPDLSEVTGIPLSDLLNWRRRKPIIFEGEKFRILDEHPFRVFECPSPAHFKEYLVEYQAELKDHLNAIVPMREAIQHFLLKEVEAALDV